MATPGAAGRQRNRSPPVSEGDLVLFLEASVRLGVPLGLAAMGEAIAERSGVINLGLEGSIIAGALGGALGALAVGNASGGVVVGLLAGACVAAVFAAFAVGLRTDQIITGTAVTLGGLGMTGAVYQARFGATGTALTLPTLDPMPIPGLADLPWIGSALFAQAPTAYLAYALAPLLWLAVPDRPGRIRFAVAAASVSLAGYLPWLWLDAEAVIRSVFLYPGLRIQTTAGMPIWGLERFLPDWRTVAPDWRADYRSLLVGWMRANTLV